MNPYRFYVPDLLLQSSGGQITLPDDQAHHARSVLRLEGGEPVLLFDGKGAWSHATLSGEGGRKGRTLCAIPTGGVHIDPAPAVSLTIATAVPKGDRAEWLIEQASQLNVHTVQWLDCDRSVVKPREGGQKIEKWRRLAVESAKQCHRTHVMQVEEPVALSAVLEKPVQGKLLWLEPREGDGSISVGQAVKNASTIAALIGPEGGWSDREFTALEKAAQAQRLERVRLTETILRIETACAAIAAIVMSDGVKRP